MDRTKELNDALNELERVNHQLSRQSREDDLTRVLNRRAFDELLETEWKRAQRSRNPLALVIGDIDFFKAINDQFGNEVGDDCLRLISATLKRNLSRPGDNLFRYGGEAFAFILPETDLEGAVKVAERMREAVARQNVQVEDKQCPVSMSFGVVAVVPNSSLTLEGLLFGADQALYRAKENGRNRVEPIYSIEEPSF